MYKGGQFSERGRRLSSQATVNMMRMLTAQHIPTDPQIVKARLIVTRERVNGRTPTTEMLVAAGELPTYAADYAE